MSMKHLFNLTIRLVLNEAEWLQSNPDVWMQSGIVAAVARSIL